MSDPRVDRIREEYGLSEDEADFLAKMTAHADDTRFRQLVPDVIEMILRDRFDPSMPESEDNWEPQSIFLGGKYCMSIQRTSLDGFQLEWVWDVRVLDDNGEEDTALKFMWEPLDMDAVRAAIASTIEGFPKMGLQAEEAA